MTKEELKKYEEILLKRRAELEKELKDIPLVTEMGSDTEGEIREEEADEAEEMTTNYALRQTLSEELGEVNKALESIKNGAYGQCEKCGREIEKEVLGVAPESHLCENCKINS